MKKIFQVLFCVAFFLLGLWLAISFGSREGGTTQGNILSVALTSIVFFSSIISLSIFAFVALWKRKADWCITVAAAFVLMIVGIAVGILQDIVFITPAEYGERGWAWAVGRYGSWRVLR